MTSRTRLAVLGSPIAHSKSPAIHRAAYRVLGLDWEYGSAEVTGSGLASFVEGLDDTWRGLSLTMPLKRDVLPLLDTCDPLVAMVGAANTVRFDDAGRHGFNTDVTGGVRALQDAGLQRVEFARILGAGATAASMLASIAELGARSASVSARTPVKALPLVELGRALGVDVRVQEWGVLDDTRRPPDVIVSTVPGGAAGIVVSEHDRHRSVLFEVAYEPWPTPLVREWEAVGGTIVTGLDLLVGQAVGQVRVFLTGDPLTPLPDEPAVVAAMRAAL